MDVVTFVAVMVLRMAQRTLPSVNPAAAVISASAAPTDAVDRRDSIIAEAAKRFAIPEAWIRAVMRAESAGQATLNGWPSTSPAGAMGLMQIIPESYDDMRRRFGLSPNPYDPHDNILAGAAYLREMFDRFGYPHGIIGLIGRNDALFHTSPSRRATGSIPRKSRDARPKRHPTKPCSTPSSAPSTTSGQRSQP